MKGSYDLARLNMCRAASSMLWSCRIVQRNRFGSIINDCPTTPISERWGKSIIGFLKHEVLFKFLNIVLDLTVKVFGAISCDSPLRS